MLLHLQSFSRQASAAAAFTVPSGWSLLGQSDPMWLSNNITASQIFTYWKIATSTETTTGTAVTFTGWTSAAYLWAAVVDRYTDPNGFVGTYSKLSIPTQAAPYADLTDTQPSHNASVQCIAVYHAIGQGTSTINGGPSGTPTSTALGSTGGQLRGKVDRLTVTAPPPPVWTTSTARAGTSVVFALRLNPAGGIFVDGAVH